MKRFSARERERGENARAPRRYNYFPIEQKIIPRRIERIEGGGGGIILPIFILLLNDSLFCSYFLPPLLLDRRDSTPTYPFIFCQWKTDDAYTDTRLSLSQSALRADYELLTIRPEASQIADQGVSSVLTLCKHIHTGTRMCVCVQTYV